MPATTLAGKTTASGWQIGELITSTSGSGGNFCVRYTAVSPEGKLGFLKAMDLTKAMQGGLVALNNLTNEYLFEKKY